MNKPGYRELQMRLKENRQLGRGGVGRWSASRRIALSLAVRPWRVIGPVAGAVALASWWVWRENLTRVILRVFGGA